MDRRESRVINHEEKTVENDDDVRRKCLACKTGCTQFKVVNHFPFSRYDRPDLGLVKLRSEFLILCHLFFAILFMFSCPSQFLFTISLVFLFDVEYCVENSSETLAQVGENHLKRINLMFLDLYKEIKESNLY